MAAGAIDRDWVHSLRAAFAADPRYRMAQNAVTRVPLDDLALDREILNASDHTFSHKLDDWTVTHQKQSGRCWMFAGLNLIRAGIMRSLNLENLELSQNFPLFWDKFERSNYFLEAIIATADRDIDDRTVAFLLERPLDDGGQWNMFVNIVHKYGAVPKVFMPETESSSNTRKMNTSLKLKLREGALRLREAVAAGASAAAVRQQKHDLLTVIHRILCIHLGTPPESFLWQWHDKDKQFHRAGELTPRAFAEKYVTIPLDEYVCLVHDPRAANPAERTYTVEYLGNVVGGEIVKYLNVDIELMKDIAARVIVERQEPVWFGCDTEPQMRSDLGLWHAALFDYGKVYDTAFPLTKEQRLLAHETLMTHAMLFTGVDMVEGKPRRWRVENSWGDTKGEKGFYLMHDSWFNEYMFEIAARRDLLPASLQAALDQPPTVLPAWDPMGALARG